jgi:nitrite reductase/ring-hydroxylating ferredoxin subunit
MQPPKLDRILRVEAARERYRTDNPMSKAYELLFVPLLQLRDLPEGVLRDCKHKERELLVCRIKDQVFCVDNICTHALGRLSEGRLRGIRLICPLHGASFDIRDGAVLGPPACGPIRAYATRVSGGVVEAAIDIESPSIE